MAHEPTSGQKVFMQRPAASRLSCILALFFASSVWAAEPAEFAVHWDAFRSQAQPLLVTYCHDCHAGDLIEADVDLAQFTTLAALRQQPELWQRVSQMFDSRQMPPPDAPQPSDAQRQILTVWVHDYLQAEAQAHAGDPGPVVLRRLNNLQYTLSVRDLTGVDSLDPASEFPADSAAGEGFTNTGQALVMSPALFSKYLDAAKQIAAHAVLLPDGMRFSPSTSQGDWIKKSLTKIRAFYRQFTDDTGGDRVNLQGIEFSTNEGGRLPLQRYLRATLAERNRLTENRDSFDQVAHQHGLSPKYLRTLWQLLARQQPSTTTERATETSPLIAALRQHWQAAQPDDAAAVLAEIAPWQTALWRFSSVGHIGKRDGPLAWMEPIDPIVARQEVRLPLAATDAPEIILYLTTGDAGDGNTHDYVVWERPRLVAPGRPDLLLRDVSAATYLLAQRREQLVQSAAGCLTAVADAMDANSPVEVATLAKRHQVDADALRGWLDYLGIAQSGPAKPGALLQHKSENLAGYDFVTAWVADDALSVVANASDQAVRIPGNLGPHSVAVHPSPNQAVVVGWRAADAQTLSIAGDVEHAHPECGNGVEWALELRRGNTRQRLAAGISHGANKVPFGPLEEVRVRAGDMIALAIHPRDGNHSCDLTAVNLRLDDGQTRWDLAQDVSSDILAGNPHADRHGRAEVWHFFSESSNTAEQQGIPAGSLLAKWQIAASPIERRELAQQIQTLLVAGPASLPADSPDAELYRQLTSLAGPLLSSALDGIAENPSKSNDDSHQADSRWGLPPERFGTFPGDSPSAGAVESASICLQAPSVIEVRLPAELVAGAEFVTSATLHSAAAGEGSVQVQVGTTPPAKASGLQPTDVSQSQSAASWTSQQRSTQHHLPIIVAESGAARQRLARWFAEFREIFPAALCYSNIVPVDEVITLTLFHREDEPLQRLMLDDAQRQQLDALWAELRFVSQDALTLVDAFAQLLEYASQDADPSVFEPLRQPILDRAEQFRQTLLTAEPQHLNALLDFAERAFRRPLAESESQQLRSLYQQLRAEGQPHDEALRLLIARVLVSPAFLYRLEVPGPGAEQVPVSDFELATRLSFFLWSSPPDAELLQLAAAGKLRDDNTLLAQARRLLHDDKSRWLASEFACQWLHLTDFAQLDEKSERHFPAFADLRGAMHEEAVQFFTDLFRNDRSILTAIETDYTFLNDQLAAHYAIPGVEGPAWRRVDGVSQFGRGGVLTLAATLAKQSGASRTSPILRGAWISEVILGEKLPRPPKDVPVLADELPDGLTERQLTERHSSDASCAKCHARIDPFGFSLEHFDAIGRYRDRDAADLAINAEAVLPDGSRVAGHNDLKRYLLTNRRDAFVRQFTRKLLGYALGRSVQLSDEPLLDTISTALSADGYRAQIAIEHIVSSRQFREIRGTLAADASPSATEH